MHRISLVATLTLIACGGKTTTISDPIDSEPVPTVTPTPAPSAPTRAGGDLPSTDPVTTTTQSLRASCESAHATLVDGNRWDSIQHFDHAFELASALPGTWYACTKNPLFGDDGIALHADGTASLISFDGKTITEGDTASSWTATDGLAWTDGFEPYWAVISLDGKQAVMGKPELGSSEFIFVRVD